MKRTRLGVGAKSLERGSTFASPRRRLKHPKRVSTFTLEAKGESRCRVCRHPAQDPHHAVPRSQSRIGRDNLLNLLPLCRDCHDAWHAGTPILRSVFTDSEWAFISTLENPSWLDRRYPVALERG